MTTRKIHDIANIISNYTGIDSRTFLYDRTRRYSVIISRQIFHYVMKRTTGLSLQDIGDITGHDHATVINSIRTVDEYIDTEYNPITKTYTGFRELIGRIMLQSRTELTNTYTRPSIAPNSKYTRPVHFHSTLLMI